MQRLCVSHVKEILHLQVGFTSWIPEHLMPVCQEAQLGLRQAIGMRRLQH